MNIIETLNEDHPFDPATWPRAVLVLFVVLVGLWLCIGLRWVWADAAISQLGPLLDNSVEAHILEVTIIHDDVGHRAAHMAANTAHIAPANPSFELLGQGLGVQILPGITPLIF